MLARIEAAVGRDASDLLELRERCLELFKVTSHEEDVTLLEATSRAGDGNGSAVFMGSRKLLRLTLTSTSFGAAGPLAVTIQGSKDGSTGWYALGTFTNQTGASSERKTFVSDRYVRAAYTLGGDTVAFGVEGEAHWGHVGQPCLVAYCDLALPSGLQVMRQPFEGQ